MIEREYMYMHGKSLHALHTESAYVVQQLTTYYSCVGVAILLQGEVLQPSKSAVYVFCYKYERFPTAFVTLSF